MMFLFLLSSFLTLVGFNCENLFDCRHDSLKQDVEFLPEAPRHWTRARYWRKLNNISKAIVSCGDDVAGGSIPDFVALCEVENDSVLTDLTRRSLLRNAGYEYLMTDSPDERGIDVALLYSPFSFAPIHHYPLRVAPVKGMHATRDILYVSGRIITGDTLHIFVYHAPSRYGGEKASRPFRQAAADRLCASVDSIRTLSPEANIIVAGDFNDYTGDAALSFILNRGLTDAAKDAGDLTKTATAGSGFTREVTKVSGFMKAATKAKADTGVSCLIDVTSGARGLYGRAKGTYRYNGRWGSLDHILMSHSLASLVLTAFINDAPFLLEEDKKYGGFKPFRSYTGYRYSAEGTSDHLPLVVRFKVKNEE